MMPLALVVSARASKIGFLDARYLFKLSTGYIFSQGKNTQEFRKDKPRIQSKFYSFKEKTSCLSRQTDLSMGKLRSSMDQV